MRWLAIFITLLSTVALSQIARDSCGVVVEIREKYGPVWMDTATVVSMADGCFVLTKRAGLTGWYSMQNYSVRIIERLDCETDF